MVQNGTSEQTLLTWKTGGTMSSLVEQAQISTVRGVHGSVAANHGCKQPAQSIQFGCEPRDRSMRFKQDVTSKDN